MYLKLNELFYIFFILVILVIITSNYTSNLKIFKNA